MIYLSTTQLTPRVFPNGEVRIPSGLPVPRYVRWQYEGDHEIFELAMVADALGRDRPPLLIDYLPYSRMDRDDGHSHFALRTLTRQINAMDWPMVAVLEPHSDVSVALIDRAKPVWASETLALALNQPGPWVFPDAGAQKRYGARLPGPSMVCFKVRNPADGSIDRFRLVTDEVDIDPASRVVVVDDLCSRGRTFQLAAEAVNAAGFLGQLILIVTHLEPVITSETISLYNRILCTNSLGQQPDHPKIYRVPTLHIYRNSPTTRSIVS